MPNEEYYLVTRSDMEDVADAIRTAGGTSAGLEWKFDWIEAISALSKSVIGLRSGNMISIPDGTAGDKLIALTVGIHPMQSGTGDPSPSNIRPITEWTGCHVYVSPTQSAQDGDTYTVSWQSQAGVVCAGTLNVTTGKLTMTFAYQELTGNETWSSMGSYWVTAAEFNTKFYYAKGTGMCSHLVWRLTDSNAVAYSVCTYAASGSMTKGRIAVKPGSDITSTNALKAWLQAEVAKGTPVQVVYQMTEPVEYTLTPTQITMLEGQNYIWTDLDGECVCLYVTENGQDYKDLIPSGSGSGGSVSWDKTADQDISIISDNPNYFVINNYTVPLQADETYRVTWGSGGTVYTCETSPDSTGTAYDGYFFGNSGLAGGTDTGEPFLIYRDRADRLVGVANQSAGTIHIIIERQVSGGGSATLVSKTITANGIYDPADDSADGYSEVTAALPAGTEGTPTATKGSVSNHAISVTPSVTNTGGVISGGTHTGIAVSVTASELASGNKEIIANGTNIDVVGYSTVSVAVSSKNVQATQSTTRRNNTALGSITSLTCSTAGTYDIYWTCARSNTSQTWGSQLYINGSAYGTENTTWSNNVQNNHLTEVTLAKNDTVAVYGRSRSGYYIYAPQLTIIQTA